MPAATATTLIEPRRPSITVYDRDFRRSFAHVGVSRFYDALRFAYDGAFRARECFTLAQRAAYGMAVKQPRLESGEERALAARVHSACPMGNLSRALETGTQYAQIADRSTARLAAELVARHVDPPDATIGFTRVRSRHAYKFARARHLLRGRLLGRRPSPSDAAVSYARVRVRVGTDRLDCVLIGGRVYTGIRSWKA